MLLENLNPASKHNVDGRLPKPLVVFLVLNVPRETKAIHHTDGSVGYQLRSIIFSKLNYQRFQVNLIALPDDPLRLA